MYPLSSVRFKHVTDGTSHTLLIGEVSWDDSRGTRVWVVGSLAGRSSSSVDDCNFLWSNYGGRNIAWQVNSFFATTLRNDIPFGSLHTGGAHFAFADGSGRMISEEIPIDTLKALGSRSNGEMIASELQ